MADIKRGTKVFFKGRMGVDNLITYVWAISISPGKTAYIIEHPAGQAPECFISDSLGTGHKPIAKNELDESKKYLEVTDEEINVI